jgi:F-type H+-transporting ATPase subunit epsilon
MVDTAHHAPSESLRCVVVTPERALLDEPADFVVVPLYDGELGVLPGRLPLVGRLGFGELRLKQGQTVRRFYVDGGFAQVRKNVVTVLTTRALKPEEIDVAAAQRALSPEHAPALTPAAQEARTKAQERARAMLRLAGHTGAAAGHP